MWIWMQRVAALCRGEPEAVSPSPPGLRARPGASQAPGALPGPARLREVNATLADRRDALIVAEPEPEPEPEAADPQLAFFGWLLGTAATPHAPLRASEQRLLAWLDAVLATDSARNKLLPRAPAVIPQLMNSLRDESQSAQALAERIAKDPTLVAEVIRLANGAGVRAVEPVSDLPQAVGRLGTQGLRRAIAKVVLKPIFQAPAASYSGRAAPRLWAHAEVAAAECMRLAAAAGLDPFEGYLAGLMHNIGWTAVLHALDKAEGMAKPPFTAAFVQAFEVRREKFFASVLQSWQLTDSLTALAAELLGHGVEPAASTLAKILRAADRCASLAMLGAGAAVPDGASPAGGGAQVAFDDARRRAADRIVSESSESSVKGA